MFFYTIFGLFCIIHCYLFIKLRQWLGRGKWPFAAVPWFALMLSVWWFRHLHTHSAVVEALFTVGFAWLGFSIIAASCFAVFDVIAVLGVVCGKGKRLFVSVPVIFVLALCISGYSLWEAHNIQPYHVTISTKKLPKGVQKRRIVFVSDVHLSRSIGAATLTKIVGISNEAKPDIFISLGDLVDTDMTDRAEDAAILQQISAPMGKFAVLGNHEVYRGLEQAIAFHNLAGLTLLRGETRTMGGMLLVGVDDPLVQRKIKVRRTLATLLEKPSDMFTLVLAHRPKVQPKRIGAFDIQLSGHTHGGQVWPGALLFGSIIHKVSQHLSVLQRGDNMSLLFITNGAGFWGPPMRFLTPPEVVIMDIIAEQ